jgi:hypothetical protein
VLAVDPDLHLGTLRGDLGADARHRQVVQVGLDLDLQVALLGEPRADLALSAREVGDDLDAG